ncbi:MAG: hypothetical protein P1P88_23680, partial [Bacteroidales bacterium]|nr:hypothetical protein [Bacteroidales bacterium]
MKKIPLHPIIIIISLFALSSCLKNDITTLPEPVKRPINLSNPVEVYHELSELNDLPETEEEYDTVFVDTSL